MLKEDGLSIKEIKLQGVSGTFVDIIFSIVSVGLLLYTMYIGLFGPPNVMIQRGLHLTIILFLIPLYYPSGSERLFRFINISKTSYSLLEKYFNIFISLLGVGSSVYALMNWERFFTYELSSFDMIVLVTLTIIVLECTRRAIGLPIVIIALVAIAYSRFGNYLYGPIAHKGYSFYRIINMISVGTEGLFSFILGASSTFIAAFLVIAAFFQASGALKCFMRLAFSIAGNYSGGPAKIAVISSGMTGMISGSTVANVTATGSITIPLMKRMGFSPYFAGAVEAVSSAGGSITPPVMGATAFLIAEILGISYWEVVVAAAIPAFLYYTSLFTVVHLRSLKLNMKGLPKNELPSFISSLKESFSLIIPIFLLVYLLSAKYSALFAASWTTIALLIMSSLKKDTRVTLSGFLKAARLMARTILPISSACATAGIIIAMLNMTGLAQKAAYLVTTIAQGRLLVALFLIQIVALVLGMGLVTSATYTLLAVLCAPSLVKMGVIPLAAHLFIFHFAIMGTLTPPVCLASFAAAGIAEANPMKTGIVAFGLALPGLIVPYLFVMNPALIGLGTPLDILKVVLLVVIGIMCIDVSIIGFLHRKLKIWERTLFAIGGISLLFPSAITYVIGFVL